MAEKRGRWTKEISEHEEAWEDFQALLIIGEDFSGFIADCDELTVRCHQVLHRNPELRRLVQPGLDRLESMKARLIQMRQRYKDAPQALREWREEEIKLHKEGKLDK